MLSVCMDVWRKSFYRVLTLNIIHVTWLTMTKEITDYMKLCNVAFLPATIVSKQSIMQDYDDK